MLRRSRSNHLRSAVVAITVAIVMSWALLLGTSAAPTSTSRFEQGLSAYASGQFEEAARLFREDSQRDPSSEGWGNLGDAEWHCGRAGEAVLAWERALWINPRDQVVESNLRHAREVARVDAVQLRWWESYSAWLPMNAWAWVATAGFWVLVCVGFALPAIGGWRKSAWSQAVAALGLAVFLLAIPGVAGIHTRSAIAVVVASDSPLRQTPTHHGQVLKRLAAGNTARFRRIRGEFVFVQTGGGDLGWLERSQLRSIPGP